MRRHEDCCRSMKEAQVCHGGGQIGKAPDFNVVDEMIQIDVEPEQIGDAALDSFPMIGHEVMARDGCEQGLHINDRVDQEQQVEGVALPGHLERHSRCQVARHGNQWSGRPRAARELHDGQKVVVQAP